MFEYVVTGVAESKYRISLHLLTFAVTSVHESKNLDTLIATCSVSFACEPLTNGHQTGSNKHHPPNFNNINTNPQIPVFPLTNISNILQN